MAKNKQESPEGSVHVSIRLPRELVEWIDQQAITERRIRTQMIRILLEDARDVREER